LISETELEEIGEVSEKFAIAVTPSNGGIAQLQLVLDRLDESQYEESIGDVEGIHEGQNAERIPALPGNGDWAPGRTLAYGGLTTHPRPSWINQGPWH
jgi:hypothetical protein